MWSLKKRKQVRIKTILTMATYFVIARTSKSMNIKTNVYDVGYGYFNQVRFKMQSCLYYVNFVL